jgi:hypothetical protein
LEDALAPPPSETRPRPDVVVLHERRRREDLLESLDRVHADPALGGSPLVVVDHERDIERFIAAVGRGAAACVCPPLDPAYLRATVTRLARWRDGKGSGDRRRRRRRPLLLRVDVHLPDARVLVGLLRDVSGAGCRIESPERVAPGTEVSITPYGYDASLEFRIGAVVHRHLEPAPGITSSPAGSRARGGDGAAAVCGAKAEARGWSARLAAGQPPAVAEDEQGRRRVEHERGPHPDLAAEDERGQDGLDRQPGQEVLADALDHARDASGSGPEWHGGRWMSRWCLSESASSWPWFRSFSLADPDGREAAKFHQAAPLRAAGSPSARVREGITGGVRFPYPRVSTQVVTN